MGRRGREGDETKGGHEGLEIVVSHDRVEGPGEPKGEFLHTQFHPLQLLYSLHLSLCVGLLGYSHEERRDSSVWNFGGRGFKVRFVLYTSSFLNFEINAIRN